MTEETPPEEGEQKPGAWIAETVERARERFERLPKGARPVVTRPVEAQRAKAAASAGEAEIVRDYLNVALDATTEVVLAAIADLRDAPSGPSAEGEAGPAAGAIEGLLRSLDHLAEMWARGRTYSGSGRPEDDLASTLRRFREGHDVTPKVGP